MWNVETFFRAIATSPLLWGASAIALITLAMLWRIVAHANFVRRWQVKQQLWQVSARTSPDHSDVGDTNTAVGSAQENIEISGVARDAALVVVSGQVDVLQLQTYEDIQNPQDTQELLFDLNINVSNLSAFPLQVIESSLHADGLKNPFIIDIPALIRAEHGQQLTQCLRHEEYMFTYCHIFYMNMHKTQPQLYRLRCPLQWSEQKQRYVLQVGAQQIQPVISLESQGRHDVTNANDAFNNRLNAISTNTTQSLRVNADALAEALQQRVEKPTESANEQDISSLAAANPSPKPHADAESPATVKSQVEGLEPAAHDVVQEGTSHKKNLTMTSVIERWFDEDPELKTLPQDSMNEVKQAKTAYKKAWSNAEEQSVLKRGKFPERF